MAFQSTRAIFGSQEGTKARKARVRVGVEYDRDKIDEMVLALLWLTQTGERRAWKSHDWGALERLHAKGYISDPRTKAKSVVFSDEGERRARDLFEHHFGRR